MSDRKLRRLGVEVLLAVARDRGRMASLTPRKWVALLPAADEARLLPRLAIEAEQLGLTSSVPDWVRDRLIAARVRGEEFQRAVLWEVNRIHRALLPIGVRPVFLKGAAYIAAGLPCGVGRVVADVDILVPESQLPAVQSALREQGWEFEPLEPYDERYYREWMHELPPMRNQDRGTMLDVHHRILPRTGRMHPPTERLLEQAVQVDGVRVLSPEHMVLHAAAHLFQDGEIAGALRDIVDIRDMLEAFIAAPDFELRLVEEAAALGLGRPLFYAVRYARHVGSAVTVHGADRWRPSPPALALMDSLVARTLTGLPGPWSSSAAFALYVRSHWLKMPLGRLLRHLVSKAIQRHVTAIRLAGMLALIAAVTFPWDFQGHPHWYKVGWLPFVTGIVRPHDLVINVALYFPIGFLLPAQTRRGRVASAVGVSLLVSAVLELTQVWSHVRFPSATDVLMNVIGGVAGAIVATRGVSPA